MKKIIAILLSVLMLFLSLVGCNKAEFKQDVNCEKILEAVKSVTSPPEAENVYLKSQENIDAFSFSLWADGLFEESDENTILSDYAIYVGAGVRTFEITVLRAKTADNVTDLEKIIERRKKTLKSGEKGAYDPKFEKRMSNSVIHKFGEYLIFLITDNNDEALQEIEKLKVK